MLADQYKRVLERVRSAELRAGRKEGEVRLMAVTKTVDEPVMLEAMHAGARLFGENRVQELVRKRTSLPLENCELHLIGHLQSNKVAKAVQCADMIQSVDSLRLAREISDACIKQNKTLPILLEVNIGHDPAKYGFLPEEMDAIIAEISTFSGIKTHGLMTVPPYFADGEQLRNFFSDMRQLFIDIQTKKMDNITMDAFDTLSMGMSGDFEIAIEEGSTLVRVGSAIFGERDYR